MSTKFFAYAFNFLMFLPCAAVIIGIVFDLCELFFLTPVFRTDELDTSLWNLLDTGETVFVCAYWLVDLLFVVAMIRLFRHAKLLRNGAEKLVTNHLATLG